MPQIAVGSQPRNNDTIEEAFTSTMRHQATPASPASPAGGTTLNKPHNRGHRYGEPTRQAKMKHDTEPIWVGPVAHLLQTRSVGLVCPTLAAVSLRCQKSIDRGAEGIYVPGHVMADSLYV